MAVLDQVFGAVISLPDLAADDSNETGCDHTCNKSLLFKECWGLFSGQSGNPHPERNLELVRSKLFNRTSDKWV